MSLTCIKTQPFRRNIFQWLNIMFNKLDYDRRKIVGPDRTCAEWLLRNGASIKWKNDSTYLNDYNKLPDENIKLYIEEINATNSSISHHGFEHFIGCEYIKKIIFHKCYYLEDQALSQLTPLKKSLIFLQITSCFNITDKGLMELTPLTRLEHLIFGNLLYVKDKEKVLSYLKKALPNCNITLKE